MKSNSLSIAYLLQNPNLLYVNTGARSHVSLIVNGLQQVGHFVRILGLKGRKVLYTDSVAEDNYCDVMGISNAVPFKLIESGLRRIQVELNLPYLGLFDNFRFYEACLRNGRNFDIFHQRQGILDMGGALASKRMGIPLILEVNTDPLFEYEFTGFPLIGIQKITAVWIAKIIYKYSTAIFCVSEAVKKNLITRWNLPIDKLFVIPNAVDVHQFEVNTDRKSVRRNLGVQEELLIIFISSFRDWHDHGLLLESFNMVLKKNADVKLLLIGDGPNRSKIIKKIEDLGLQNNVLLTGAIVSTQIPKLLYASDVAVAPIPKYGVEFWGSPMKIFEYMAAGKAVVASRAGQVAGVIEDGFNGLLVEPGNTEAFADSILRLLDDPSLRDYLGKNARQTAKKKHSSEQYIRELEDLYRSFII